MKERNLIFNIIEKMELDNIKLDDTLAKLWEIRDKAKVKEGTKENHIFMELEEEIINLIGKTKEFYFKLGMNYEDIKENYIY